MRRFLSISFISLALVISAAGVAPAAHAQFCDAGGECSYPTAEAAAAAGTTQDASAYINSATPTEAAAANNLAKDKAAAGSALDSNLGKDTKSQLNGIMAYIVQLFAWLLGVATITLDNAVYYTVVTMGNFVSHLSAIGVTWRILRDLGNIMLIFGFLAVGITTILNVDWYGGGKKMLPMMFVAAVFLNFSLFISEAIIDTGNLFATQFYTQINGNNPAGAKTFGLSSINREGISNKIMSSLGLQTIYGEAQSPEKAKALFENYWTVGFMSIILFIVTAFVFFSLAFVLIARFVILIFLIILSPVGFAALAIPMLKQKADQWWSKLFEQTITAPILLLMLYVALAVITDTSFLTGFSDCVAGAASTVTNSCSNSSYIGYVNGNFNGFAAVVLSFIVAMGLLIAVVIQSKNLAAFGAGWASRTAGKLSFGATAFVGRRTVGRVSNYAARKIRSSALGRSETGRILAGTFDRGAKASFDIRGATIGGGLKGIGVEAGEAQKGGYRAREDELIKVRTDYAKSLRQSRGQKVATETAEEEHDKNMEPLKAEEQAQLKATKDAVNASREELKIKKQGLDAARRSGNQDRIKTAETAYNNNMNTHKELVEAEREKLDPIRQKIQMEKEKLEAATKSNSIAANQRKYGEALQRKTVFGIIPRAPYDWPTAVGSARREAADKIITESKKDKNQRNLDKLEEILAKSEGKVASSGETKKPDSTQPKE